MIKTLTATEYIEPLREGGSLPAIVQADDDQLYVMKFIGAGQGPKVLIAELIAGEIGRATGLTVPEIVFLTLDPVIGRSEPDAEIQDLLHVSAGLNIGFQYLDHASAFNMLISPLPEPRLASQIVWFDAYVTNVDRTPRNVNMLIQNRQLWLIDHGAALYFHHGWQDYLKKSESSFPLIKDHILLSLASELDEIDAIMRQRLNPALIEAVVEAIPEAWLQADTPFSNPAEHRAAYREYLLCRLKHSQNFVEEAKNARAKLL
jgi:hypothetical protein